MSVAEPNQAASIARPEPVALTQPGVAPTRTKVVGVRLTEAEYAELLAAAERFHTSAPEMLRTTWFALKDADDHARRSA